MQKYREIKLTITEGAAEQQVLHLDLDNGQYVHLSWWEGMRLYFLLGQTFGSACDGDIEMVQNEDVQ